MQKSERSVYTTQDFLQWREASALELTPKFQRRGVWTVAARSFFIDTILRTMPIPPIFIRQVQTKEKNKLVREIVDGQQRVSAVLDFVDGKFRLSQNLAAPWGGKRFQDLPAHEQTSILEHSFSAEIFKGISDLQVLEIFARLNTYSVPLNAQELRNGRYFGFFKQSAYTLAYEHLEFWRRNSIFTERNIARMQEVELTSELLINQIDGMQDKKKSIDLFYARLDEEYSNQERNEKRFRDVIDTISESFNDDLEDTEFSRPPLFYSLFCTIYHRHYGLPKITLDTPKKNLTRSDRQSLLDATRKLSDFIEAGRRSEPFPQRYESFVTACLRQTDNIRPRQERLRVLYSQAFQEA